MITDILYKDSGMNTIDIAFGQGTLNIQCGYDEETGDGIIAIWNNEKPWNPIERDPKQEAPIVTLRLKNEGGFKILQRALNEAKAEWDNIQGERGKS